MRQLEMKWSCGSVRQVIVAIRIGLVLTAPLAIVACNDGGGATPVAPLPPEPGQFAVTVTAAPDFGSGATSIADVEPPRDAINNLAPTISDLGVACHARFFYRIERFGGNNVAKFDVTDPGNVVVTPRGESFQFSTDGDEAGDSNPSALVFASDTKAYLLRYGSSKAWIVDPSAGDAASFKTGELDLGAYAADGGVPHMQDAVVANGRLYIVMQRLDATFAPSNTAYLAVFDTATDTEIDTGMGAADGVKGIPLVLRNPNSLQYLPQLDTLYVEAAGRLGFPSFGIEPEYTGGIEIVDPATFLTRVLVDDGDAGDHPLGQVFRMALVSPSDGYIIGTDNAFADSTLYRFDPVTGAVLSDVNGPVAVGGLAGLNLTGLAAGPAGKLWVGNGDLAAPGLVVIDPADDSIEQALVPTGLNPLETCFAEVN
ncbi:MAG: hypothetical protein U9R74_01645 [Pseudomonadota bacterium]|nr:hypothetical protein [Pseudomonadota bacterium]